MVGRGGTYPRGLTEDKVWIIRIPDNTGTVQSAVVTVRNEVAKDMPLQACVCPQGGVWSPGVLVQGDVCSRGRWSGPRG